ncbi:MAG: hypothetical protein K2Q45_01645, partial [Nitrosomonas sp.]|nr:hypothetical protein [Nitrosomonas sp.]
MASFPPVQTPGVVTFYIDGASNAANFTTFNQLLDYMRGSTLRLCSTYQGASHAGGCPPPPPPTFTSAPSETVQYSTYRYRVSDSAYIGAFTYNVYKATETVAMCPSGAAL